MTTEQPTAEERKRQTAADFDRLAGTYDTRGFRFVVPVAERLVQLADLQAGDKVLDVATGTGWAALGAAKAVGPSGHVLGIDLAEGMLGPARAKAAALALANAEFAVGDAESLDAEYGAFDVVQCASAIFMFPHPDVAVGEWRRVTKPGGKVLFSTWGPRPIGGVLRELLVAHLQRFSLEVPNRPMNQMEDSERLLESAGLEGISVTDEHFVLHVPDAEAWWSELEAGPSTQFSLARLTPEQLPTFRHNFLADVALLATPEGIPVPVHVVYAWGRVPAR